MNTPFFTARLSFGRDSPAMLTSSFSATGLIEKIWRELQAQYGPNDLFRVRRYLENMLSGDETPSCDDNRALFRHLYFPDLTARPVWDPAEAGIATAYLGAKQLQREALISLRNQDEIEDHSDLTASTLSEPSGGWDCVYFVRGFEKVESTIKKYPKTWDFLSRHRLSVEAFYSRLKAGSIIERHSDQANYVLTVHVPLHDHEAQLSVSECTLSYVEGNILCFDSSYFHSVDNATRIDRDILLFNVWHPDLTVIEIGALEKIRQIWPQQVSFDPDEGFSPKLEPGGMI